MKLVNIVTGAFLAFVFLTVSYSIGYNHRNSKIISIRQMQKKLGCSKIDGKLGPCWRDSETQAKWSTAYLKQHNQLMY